MRKLKTVDARRRAAIALVPQLTHLDHAMRERSIANGNDSELVHLRTDKLYMLRLRGFETPCGWSQSEAWDAMKDENR
jgi:hypothetical protein